MNRPEHQTTLAYIIAIEDIVASPLLQSQVYNMLATVAQERPDLRIVVVALYPLHNLLRSSAEVRRLRQMLEREAITLRVAPIAFLTRYFYVPWWLLPLFAIQAGFTALWLTLRLDPAFVHCRSYPASIVGSIVKALNRSHLIFDTRSLYPEEGAVRVLSGKPVMFGRLSYRIWKRLEKALIGHADAVISVSEACSELLRAHYPRSAAKMKTVPTVTRVPEPEALQAWRGKTRAAFEIEDEEIVVSYVGTWFPTEIALPLFQRMTAALPGAKWYYMLIVATRSEGNPERYRATLERLVTGTLGEGVRCQVLSLPHDEVAQNLAAGDVAVQPAAPPAGDRGQELHTLMARTALSVKLTEYLASGLPVIVSQYHGAAAQVVTQNNLGIVYEQATDEALARWLRITREAPDSERERIWRFARDHFSLAIVARQYLDIYEQLSERRR